MEKEKIIPLILSHSLEAKTLYDRLLKWDPDKTVSENAITLKISNQNARRLIFQYQLPFLSNGKSRREYKRKDYSEIIKNWNDQLSISENAKQLHINYWKALQLRSKFNLPYLKITKWEKYYIPASHHQSTVREKMQSLRDQGFSLSQIGKIYNLTRERIRQLTK